MKTKQQVADEFRAELQALLDKYGADLEAEDHYPGYPECGQDIRMTATVPAIYDDATNDCLREFVEIDLGQYMYPSKQESPQ